MNTPQFDWALNKTKSQLQPLPPIYEPELVARAILFAATHKRREVWVGGSTALTILATRIAPGLLDWYLGRKAFDAQLSVNPKQPNAPDNLFEPAPGHETAHGRFGDRAQATSVQLFIYRYCDAVLAGAAVFGLFAAGRLLARLRR